MATYTEHYNLIKPALNDKVNINNLNDNADIIDAALNNKVNTDDTQNITTSANNCMLSDGVTSVENRLDAANIDSAVNISSYTSSSNVYTCPSDGYVRISGTTSTMATLYLMDKALTTPYTLLQTNTAYSSIFMRKGAKIYVNNVNTALFLPLS